MGHSRRALLAVASSTLLAGCPSNVPENPPLVNFRLLNDTDLDVDGQWRAWKDGELVHEESFELSGDDFEGTREYEADWMRERSEYAVEVEATVDGETYTGRSETAPDETICYTVVCTIRPNHVHLGRISHDECSLPTRST